MTLSLHTISIELVYRILDNLDEQAIFLSMKNVCQRLDAVIESYHQFRVKKIVP